MKTVSKPGGKENSTADLERNSQTVIAFYTRDHRAPRAALMQRPVGWWISKIARALPRMREDRNRFEPLADHQLSKGSAKRMHLKNGARISCRRGKIWITLEKAARILCWPPLRVGTSGPGTRLLVEALVASRISLEAL